MIISNENNPKIRFIKYNNKLVLKELNEIVKIKKSYSLSRNMETDNFTGYKYIHYGDIHKQKITLITSEQELPNIIPSQYELLKKGDVIVADASEDYIGIAKPAVIINTLNQKIVAGLHTIALRPNNINSLYLYYLLNTIKFKRYANKVGTGMKVFGITSKNLCSFSTLFPSLEEQEKIGLFFKKLDERIDKQEKYIEQLKKLKTAFLQNIFPDKDKILSSLRFKGFEDKWNEDLLKNILKEKNISSIQTKQYPLVSFTVEDGVTEKTKRYQREQLVKGERKLKKYKMTELNDIVYNPANLKFGAIGRNKFGKAVFSPIYITFEVNKLLHCPTYIEYFVKRRNFIQQALKYQQGTVYERQSVNSENFLKLKISLPNIKEQEKIGLFFQKLDKNIELNENELELLKQQKQGLLQKMFI